MAVTMETMKHSSFALRLELQALLDYLSFLLALNVEEMSPVMNFTDNKFTPKKQVWLRFKTVCSCREASICLYEYFLLFLHHGKDKIKN